MSPQPLKPQRTVAILSVLVAENAAYHWARAGHFVFGVAFNFDGFLNAVSICLAVATSYLIGEPAPWRGRPRAVAACAHAALFGALLAAPWSAMRTVCAGAVFVSAFGLCYAPRDLARVWRSSRFVLPAALMLVASLLGRDVIRNHIWPALSPVVSGATAIGLRAVGLGAEVVPGFQATVIMVVRKSRFSIEVGCGGMDGLALFLAVTAALTVVEGPAFRRRLPLMLLIGLPYMVLLNVLRILSLIRVSLFATDHFDADIAHSVVAVFHSQVGIIFYLAGLAVFYGLALRSLAARG